MELDKEKILKILNTNFGFPIVETPIGKAIKMSPREAFIFSNVTGAGYLDNPIYPFTPKGLLKLFYNAFDYKFVSGLFDNGVLKNTPRKLVEAKPFLGKSDKFLIPVEFDSEQELTKILKSIYDELDNPQDYLIQRLETSKKGNGLESFMEYVVAEHFKNEGYIVENQVPLAHSIGSPDFAGYGLTDYINKIGNTNLLSKNGFHIVELSMIKTFDPELQQTISSNNDHLIVGEAKTSTTQMTAQLAKYLATGLFSKGYEIHPSKKIPGSKKAGLLSFDVNCKLVLSEPIEFTEESGLYNREEYKDWLKNYVKFNLIANLNNDELNAYHKRLTGRSMNSTEDLVKFVLDLEVEDLLIEINPK